MAVPMLKARILREVSEVDPALAGFDLTWQGLLKVRTMALGASADATPFHAANASGTFAYHYGIYGLRNEFVGKHWRADRPKGIEVIRNEAKNMLVGFANVDVACNDEHEPIPRSHKGAGSERVSQTEMFPVEHFYPEIPRGSRSLYYLMVAMNGAAELSCPIVREGTFKGFVDRIYLSTGEDFDGTARKFDDGDVAVTFDPQVSRKAG